MNVSSDSQVDFVIDDIVAHEPYKGMSDTNNYTAYGPPNDEQFPLISSATAAPTVSGSHTPTPGVHITMPGSTAEPSTSRGHMSNIADTTPASEPISLTTSVRQVAMGLIDGAPAMRPGSLSTMGSYGDTSATGFSGPSAIALISGDGGHLTTTFSGRLL